MSTALVTITKKHKYTMGRADGGGNKEIVVTGAITMSSETQTTTSTGVGFDLSADIPNMESVFIQGDAGFFVQYDYANKEIEVYNEVVGSDSSALAETTNSTLTGKVFYFRASGF